MTTVRPGRARGRSRPATTTPAMALAVVLAVAGCARSQAEAGPAANGSPAPTSAEAVPPSPARTPHAEPTAAPPPPPRPVEPVITGNFPDPDLLKDDGVYYAYATNSRGANVPLATAKSVEGPWTVQRGDVLPELGEWAKPGYTWAPEVVRRDDGVFVLFYTAASRRTGDQCIGAATASTPRGPFRPAGDRPLVCSGHGDAIDAAFFQDKGGRPYLLYRADQTGSRPTAIFVRPLGDRWLGFGGPATRILTWDPGTDPILVEAPALVRRDGRYVLFYSSGVFHSSNYRTRYAVADRITGPYRRAPGTLLSTDAYHGKVVGPGGADVLRDGSADHIVFHAITGNGEGGGVTRSMFVAALGWDGRRPVARGVPRRYEAERLRTVAGEVVKRPKASGDRALDLRQGPGLQVKVFAPEAGVYTVRLKYRLKSPRPVRLVLATEGSAGPRGSTEITLAYGGSPVSWPVASTTLSLRGGWNTVSVEGLTASLELDHVEVQ